MNNSLEYADAMRIVSANVNETVTEDVAPFCEVRWLHAVHMDLRALFPSDRVARFIVRRHAKKLAYWSATESLAVDLRWERMTIRGDEGFGELFIEEPLGDYSGVRHAFRVRPAREASAKPVVWGLCAEALTAEPLSATSRDLIVSVR